jgi:hypothetical protein
MYSECPKCGYRFSWLRKWKLSSKSAYPCPKCQVGLLKNGESEKYTNWGIVILFIPQLPLGLISVAKRTYHFTIPDIIEFPMCILILVPAMIVGLVLVVKGLASAKFEVVENQKNG